MGGMTDEVRGSSKIKAYQQYLEVIEELGDILQSHDPDPSQKKECKRRMEQDPHTGEWILQYHLHT